MIRRVDTDRFDPNGAGAEAAGIFGLPYTTAESSLVLIPVPFEATTSYGRGTAFGPRAILRASPQLDLFDVELARVGLGHPWAWGIAMEPEAAEVLRWNAEASRLALPIIAVGGNILGDAALARDLERVDELCRGLDAWVERRAAEHLAAGKVVGLVGGDHATSFGAIAAVAAHHGEIGVLHIDAHADLREAYEGFSRSHASIMDNVLREIPGVQALVQVGIRDLCEQEYRRICGEARVFTYFDVDVRAGLAEGRTWRDWCEAIVAHLPEKVHVSFDIDGLEPGSCPHTGTPVPGGLSFGEATELLATLARSGREIVGFDLVEVAPSGGREASAAIAEGGAETVDVTVADDWDGNVGARLLYKLCGWALWTQGAKDA
jgi:agmatinase